MLRSAPSWAQGDPLPSWNDGPTKQSILDFVTRVTTAGGRDFVPVPERIATFDNDGTLWTEQPIYFQTIFAMDRVKAAVARHPEWRTTEPFRSVLADDRAQLALMGEKGMLEIIAATHAGITTEEFRQTVLDWLATARHPRFKRPYTDSSTSRCSSCWPTCAPTSSRPSSSRAAASSSCGRGPSAPTAFRPSRSWVPRASPDTLPQPDKPVLMKEAKVEFIDDGPGKAVGINHFIGRRPFFAFGNSDGDQQMLEWTAAGAGARFMGLVHHTDAVREYAYDRNSPIGRLDKAWDEAVRRKWMVVDMKNDWKVIYPFELR